jgi:hypothetical protein
MKNRKQKIDLVEIVTTQGTLNQTQEVTRVTASVIAEIDSVTQTEFFDGGRIGLKPSLRATVYDFEYKDEPIVRVGSKLYSVYRTYCINGSDLMELYLEEKGGTKDVPN